MKKLVYILTITILLISGTSYADAIIVEKREKLNQAIPLKPALLRSSELLKIFNSVYNIDLKITENELENLSDFSYARSVGEALIFLDDQWNTLDGYRLTVDREYKKVEKSIFKRLLNESEGLSDDSKMVDLERRVIEAIRDVQERINKKIERIEEIMARLN